MALSKATTRLVEEISVALGGEYPELREEGLKMAKKDHEACLISFLLRIQEEIAKKHGTMKMSLETTLLDKLVEKARQLIDEEEKPSQ